MNKSFYKLLLAIVAILGACRSEEPSITEPKLSYYVESFNLADGTFQPQTKVVYEYSTNDKLSKYTVGSYSVDSGSPVLQNYFIFSYTNNQVNQIKGYLAGDITPYIEYSYQYLSDSVVSKISENNHNAGVTSEANFSYDPVNSSSKVSYQYSNGGSFEYEFNYTGKNILSDKTTSDSQLCSDGVYTYDQHINPFKMLGYIDYTLSNVSTNNKLTETVNHNGCSFPTLVPESYTYEYDDRGYPTLATTFYKSSPVKSQKKFFYK